MRGYDLNFSHHLHPFLLLHFVVVVLCFSIRTLGDESCTNVFCGEGVCEPATTATGYNCSCNRGWRKDLGPVSVLSCIFPNCTMDLQCGNSSTPLPPLLPSFDPGPCFLVWCGYGTCVPDGTTQHICECNDAGYANLFASPQLPCLPRCSLGADCTGVFLGASATPPPPNGSDKISKRWSNCVVLLSTIILAWIMYE